MSDPGLDRAGHLSEYALDRLRFDPADEVFTPAATAHLAACETCRHRHLSLAQLDAALPLRPRKNRRVSAHRPRWPAFIAPLLLAALAFVVARPWASDTPRSLGSELASLDDVRTLKGSPLELELFIHDGTTSRLVESGATIRPGDRLGFRAWGLRDGHLLIVGQDKLGQVYGCWPQVTDVAGARAVPLTRTERPEVLPTAMRFDPVLGTEAITAIFCPRPFGYTDLVGNPWAHTTPRRVAHATPPQDGCVIRTWELHKRSGATRE